MKYLFSFIEFINENVKKWDDESVRKEALKYDKKQSFFKGSSGAYSYAVKHHMLDDLFGESGRHNWDDESVRKEAEKYCSKKEFESGSGGAYQYAVRHHMLDDLFGESGRHNWDDESVREEAGKYCSKKEFYRGNAGAYHYAERHHMLDDLFGKSFHWDDESVRNEASKYETRTSFSKGSVGAYHYAVKHHMLDEFDWMIPNYSKQKRCIYVYIDEENKVAYVGLTCNKKQRHETHKTGLFKNKPCRSAVFNYFTTIGKDIPEPIYLEDDLSPESSQDREDYWKQYYENKGYIMLNKAVTGVGKSSLGNVGKWNDINVTVEASKYDTRSEFQSGSAGAYQYAVRHHMLDDLFGELTHWDDESVREEAKKYNSIYKFLNGSGGAYTYAKRHHMLDELFPKKEKSQE